MQREDSDAAKSGCRPKKKHASGGKKAVSVSLSFNLFLALNISGV